jgi:hypothetical protein
MKELIFLTPLLIFLASCSSLRKVAISTAAPVFFEATPGFEKEGDWNNFKQSIPGNLKLVEGLLEIRPNNEALLVSAIKGFSGYAFGVYETEYLVDKYAENDESLSKNQAISFYSKAIRYGLRYFKINNIAYDDLQKAMKGDEGIAKLLDSNIGDGQIQLEGVLFFAQALGSAINLQRDNMSMAAQLPIVKGLFDWVCDKRPYIANGMCPIFNGTYLAGRPKMLGGNPEKGREIFETLIKESPHNWLAILTFMEFYIIPMGDEDLYRTYKRKLNKLQVLHQKELFWRPGEKEQAAFANKRLRLYQAIALKRFEIIKKYENDLF